MTRRGLAPLVVFALLAAACTSDDTGPEPAATAPAPTAVTRVPAATASPVTSVAPTTSVLAPTDPPPTIDPDPDFVLRYAVPGPVEMRSNPFASRTDGEFPSVFAAHLYRVLPPTGTLIPELATDDEPPAAEFDGTGWVATVELNRGLTWSDGDPIDAFDVQFTFEDLVAFGDPDEHGWVIEDPRGTADLVSVIAVDDFTVQVKFSARPTVDRWHYGVATASILPEHYWGFTFSMLAEGNEQDPDLGLEAPSAGAYRFGRAGSEDAWEWLAVEGWWNSGAEFIVFDNGAVSYENGRLGLRETYGGPASDTVVADWIEGPHAGAVEWKGHTNQAEAIVAVDRLQRYDFVVGGITTGLQTGQGPENATLHRSGSTETVALVFDPAHPALADPLGRSALSCTLALDFLTSNVLQGLALRTGWGRPELPLWTGSAYDDPCPVPEPAKPATAVGRMTLAGWTWETPPESTGPNAVIPGVGLAHETIEDVSLTVAAPSPEDNPFAATAGEWVASWLRGLGFDVSVVPHAVPASMTIEVFEVRVPPVVPIDGGAEHLSAPSVAAAAAAWTSIREAVATDSKAVPLFHWLHTDLVGNAIVVPYDGAIGGLDAMLIAAAVRQAGS